MREILFRGKRVDNGEWEYGTPLIYEGRAWLATGVFGKSFDTGFPVFMEVIPETVGQFTGLTDKNKRKMFEGDIVKVVNKNKVKYKGEIKYSGSGYFLVDKGIGHMIDVDCMACNVVVEVIGNIHDNPELLEGK